MYDCNRTKIVFKTSVLFMFILFLIMNTARASEIITQTDAARFLQQATFGPSMSTVEHLQQVGFDGWFNEQCNLAPTYHKFLHGGNHGRRNVERVTAWIKASLWGADQLRQRMAYALSEILVVSENEGELEWHQDALINYYDLLVSHSLGNYRDLLGVISRNPIMAEYLSFSGMRKSDGTLNLDENYARELLQLFTIGVFKLNIDGSLQLDENDQPIPNYSQDTIRDLAKVFTGWCFKDPYQGRFCYRHARNLIDQMEPWDAYHDSSEKLLFTDQVIPAGLTANDDMDAALDIIFAHPNVGPYVSKLLIQRLVTSNPSPDYVARVATVFNDNGSGVKGDLTAVAKAILLDTKARSGHQTQPEVFGKMREPILRMTHFWRGLDVLNYYSSLAFYSLEDYIGQAPLTAPSVFNFFPVDYAPADIAAQNLVAPETKLNSESSITEFFNYFSNQISRGIAELTTVENGKRWILYSQYQPYVDLLNQPNGIERVIERINVLFTGGQMSDGLRQAIRDLINELIGDINEYIVMASVMQLVFISPDFAVQR